MMGFKAVVRSVVAGFCLLAVVGCNESSSPVGADSFSDNGMEANSRGTSLTSLTAAKIAQLAKDKTPVRFKNRYTGKYLLNQANENILSVSALGHENWWSAQWFFEKVENTNGIYYRLRNRWKETYMHVQGRKNYVEVGEIASDWWSAQWKVNVIQDRYCLLINRWKVGHLINNQDKSDYARYDTLSLVYWSAHWTIEVI